MLEAIGYEVSYLEGFVEKGYGNQYTTKADSFIERLPLYNAIRQAQSIVLASCAETAIVLGPTRPIAVESKAEGARVDVVINQDKIQ